MTPPTSLAHVDNGPEGSSTLGNPVRTLDPNLLRSTVFKIVLKNPKTVPSSDNGGIAADAATSRERVQVESSSPEFYIHKALIQSLSPELSKHADNDMREGREGTMELSDVDDDTMQAFMEWAYTKEYTTPDPKSSSALLYHTKLYVLADRFNIIPLGNLSYSKITALLAELRMMSGEADVEAVMSTVAYAFDNLPFPTVNPTSSTTSDALSPTFTCSAHTPSNKLLKYLVQYVSWALDVLRSSSHFSDVLATSHDFARALAANSPAATDPLRDILEWAGA
ncbi:hypothetical protein BDZ91DRAFT_802508 [Kalaharituber pfeilii]|nr:hypothetical protein BDZ91DRAFT_802508 [Kalaharituber pfeilii]